MSAPSTQQSAHTSCRDYPSEKNCSLKTSGREDEVVEAAVQHAVSLHGHENTLELREQLRSFLKEEEGDQPKKGKKR